MIKRLLVGAALLVIIGVSGYYFFTPPALNIGAELPSAPALFETSLAAPITATANSLTLTSNTVRGGGTLSGYNCFTIDEGSAQAEFVCGTASGTAVTNVTRGISPSDGTSAVSALQFAHRRGASVKITDFPIIQLLRNQNNGEATFENVLRYAGTVVPSGASDLADVGYVLSVVNGGTVNFDALVVAGTAGETLATSTLVYFKSSDQRWWKVDTDDTTTYQDVAVGLTRGAGTAGVSITNGGILLKGLQTGLSGLTAGATYHASSSAGNINTNTSVLPIGVAKSTTELYFDPVMIGVPRLGMNNTFTGTNTFTSTTTFTGATVGFGNSSTTVYTTAGSSTYFKSTNVKFVIVEVVGGGGSGNGGNGTAPDGAGGGSGAYCKNWIAASELSATTTISVAAAGGSSRFGNFCLSHGGANGAADSTVPTAGAAVATLGDINLPGNPASGAPSGGNYGGNGAPGPWGGAGIGGNTTGGAAAANSGAGGGGGGNSSGGSGGTGVVIVTEYF